MSSRPLLDFLKSHSGRELARQPRRETARRLATARPWLEPFEDRCLLSNYTFTDLRSLAGLPCEARDLNNSGQVVGITYDLSAGYQPRAVLWNGSVVTSLGTLGGTGSGAEEINNVGQIVGWADRADGSRRAFLINPEDSNGDNVPDRWFRDLDANGANDLMVELPMQGATGINGGGQVIGGGIDGMYLWTPSTPNGTTGSLLALGLSPTAINDAGQIVGLATIDEYGFGSVALWQGGSTTVLAYGSAADINASGQVVGTTSMARGFLWTPNVPNGNTGTITYLDSQFDPYSYALGVNNAGQAVGKTWMPSGGWPEGGGTEYASATIWTGGQPESLTFLIDERPTLIAAQAINDSGQIIAHKFVWSWQSSDHPVLLTPITAPTPRLTISDATITEGNTGTRTATFTVALSAASSQPVTIAVATGNGSATADSDYRASSGTLTIPAGETTATITVLVNGDRLAEPDETFVVNLSSPTNATIADGQGVGTITDDEPRVTISDVTRAEGRSGSASFVFTVSLSAAYDVAVTVRFTTSNGTATVSDRDYTSASGTLTFVPGQTSKTLTVRVRGDRMVEPDETFLVNLSGGSNALIIDGQGLGTILDDDGPDAGLLAGKRNRLLTSGRWGRVP